MLNVETYQSGRIAEVINMQRYEAEPEDFEVAMEALSYCILHVAKINAITEEAFQAVYETMLIKEEFQETFYTIVKGSFGAMREIMQRENERGQIHFKDMNWRLSLVNGCRQRQRMMQPKFTCRLDTEQKPMTVSGPDSVPEPNTIVFDMDYTNMMRLEEELKAAIKSVDQ